MPVTVRKQVRKADRLKASTSVGSPSASASSLPLGKQLAHTDKTIRDSAVSQLTAFLSSGGTKSASINKDDPTTQVPTAGGIARNTSQAGTGNGQTARKGKGKLLPESEMRKLWKGIFYCFWMSDKPLVQQRLATDLSNIILAIKPAKRGGEDADDEIERLDAALDFVAGFWEAMSREWHGIDRLRLDKYYMLIRRWQAATFRLLARHGWSEYAVGRFNDILTDEGCGPLAYNQSRIPVALGWHLADVWLSELEKCAEADQTPIPLVESLQPFIVAAARTPNALTVTRYVEAIFRPFLTACFPDDVSERPTKRRKTDDSEEDEEDQEEDELEFPHLRNRCSVAFGESSAGSPSKVGQSVINRLFTEASRDSSEGVKDANRRKIYALVKEFGGSDEDD